MQHILGFKKSLNHLAPFPPTFPLCHFTSTKTRLNDGGVSLPNNAKGKTTRTATTDYARAEMERERNME